MRFGQVIIRKGVIGIKQVVDLRTEVIIIGEKQLERVAAGVKLNPERKTGIGIKTGMLCQGLIEIDHQRGHIG